MHSPHSDVDVVSVNEQQPDSVPAKQSNLSDWLGDMSEGPACNSDEPFEPDNDDYETTDADKMSLADIPAWRKIFNVESESESDPDSPSFKRFLIRKPPVQGCQTKAEAEESYRRANIMFADLKTFLVDRREPQTPKSDEMDTTSSGGMGVAPEGVDCISKILTGTRDGNIGTLVPLILCSECAYCKLMDNDRIRPTLDALDNILRDLRVLLHREIDDREEVMQFELE